VLQVDYPAKAREMLKLICGYDCTTGIDTTIDATTIPPSEADDTILDVHNRIVLRRNEETKARYLNTFEQDSKRNSAVLGIANVAGYRTCGTQADTAKLIQFVLKRGGIRCDLTETKPRLPGPGKGKQITLMKSMHIHSAHH
jgi:hypothetical protein